jgi:carboxypeptidase Q
MYRHSLLALAAALCIAVTVSAGERQAGSDIDLRVISGIRDEGLFRSQVMDLAGWLTDVYGPRLSGSPSFKQAAEWALKKFEEWKLDNIRQERFALGKGWSLVRFHADLLEPQIQPIIGYPTSWTGGTPGPVVADVVLAPITTDADFAQYRGALRGKIVLTQSLREVHLLERRMVFKYTDDELKHFETTPDSAPWMLPLSREAIRRADEQRERVLDFYEAEGAVALFERGDDASIVPAGPVEGVTWETQRADGGTIITGRGLDRTARAVTRLPRATIAVEHYNRMVRVLAKRLPVKVRLDVEVKFHDEAVSSGINTLAEIQGTDLRHEVVLIGAHLDAYHTGTGATDNAAGSAAMMEAMRILRAIGVRPRRTIRVALWDGEELDKLGSQAYIDSHLVDRSTGQPKPGYENLAAYFNLDNGAGRIRGVYLQNNLAVKPIFERWIEPVRDLKVTMLAPRSPRGSLFDDGRVRAGTDHIPFDLAGLPAFQFLQDRLEYFSRSHHSNMDVYDRLQAGDLAQVATVAAVFAYNAAMWPSKLPRKTGPVAASVRKQDN